LEIFNIPLVNLRSEFFTYYVAFKRKDIEDIINRNIELFNVPFRLLPIHNKEILFTLILQRIILGFEAFYKGAIFHIFGMRGADVKTLRSLKQNPMKYGNGYCDAVFIRIPTHLNENYPLDTSNSELYDKVCKFYKDVRNQLFHGCQFSKIEIDEFQDFLRMYKGLYDWLCDWVGSEFEVIERSTGSLIPEDDFIRSIFAKDIIK
jgi:hypothetical protein